MDPNNSYFLIEMSAKAFISANVPCSALSTVLNIFFIYCMVVPQQGAEPMKEPLKVLLGSLVACNMIINFCILLLVVFNYVLDNMCHNCSTDFEPVIYVVSIFMTYTMMTIVTSCHWKNMFYFCQIVPLQHPSLIWFKRNIRAFVYSALILNVVFYLFGLITDIRFWFITSNIYSKNVTSADKNNKDSIQISSKIQLVYFWTMLAFVMFSYCVMLASSYMTVLYLWRHMKNVEKSGISSPRLHRQIKTIIVGITIQAVVHFLCSTGIIIDRIGAEFCFILDWNENVICTMISMYSFGTTINLSFSQSWFHQRLVQIWQKILKGCNP